MSHASRLVAAGLLITLVSGTFQPGWAGSAGGAPGTATLFGPPTVQMDRTPRSATAETPRIWARVDRLRLVEDAGEAGLAYRYSAASLLQESESPTVPDNRSTPASRRRNPASAVRDDNTLFGEAPPDNALVFLRQSAVLLKPGTLEVEFGLRYTLQENAFLALLPDGSIVPEYANTRTLVGALAVRYGWTERLQPFVILPAGVSLFERTHADRDQTDEQAGLGDVAVGVNYLLRDGKNRCADLVLAFSATAPTGVSTYDTLSPNIAPLGTGFAGLNTTLSWIRNYDPIVLFASVGYTHQFARSFFNRQVQPGETVNYGFGAGFAVNDTITLSSQYQSSYQFDTFVAGQRIYDTRTEVSVLRHSVVVRTCPQSFLEVFLTHGVTSQAPRTAVGILNTRRY